MIHGSLFSGIGGFDLAAEWMGWQNAFHCEWNDFNQKVLKYYWPNAESYADITKTDFTIWRGRIDILTGGFPCQPYSVAGKRKGKEDDRHLWPEMLRAIREIQPRFVVGENVPGLIGWNDGLVFDEVQTDLEAEGYEVIPFILPACGVNAPHRRDRVWFVAYSDKQRKRRAARKDEGKSRKERLQERNKIQQPAESSEVFRNASNANKSSKESSGKSRKTKKDWSKNNDEQGSRGTKTKQHLGRSDVLRNASNSSSGRRTQNNKQQQPKEYKYACTGWEQFPTQAAVCHGDDGLSERLDAITFPAWRRKSIEAGGNAIVPQVALQIFKAIQDFSDAIS